MICFGTETENNKIIKTKEQLEEEADDFFFFSLSLLFSIYGNRTVRIRRGKKQSALLNEGYAWEPKTQDFAEFLIKIRKILCFGFSQIYGFLPVRIGRRRRSN